MSSPAGHEGVREFEAPTSKRHEALRIWLLGGFRVSIGSRLIEEGAWRLSKAVALVKMLALAPNHRLHREQVIEALWPDFGMRAASNNLRQTLHATRQVLEPDRTAASRYLILREAQLALSPKSDLWVDVDAFEAAAATARHAMETAAYHAAIDLYVGHLLPEDRYEEWAEEPRRRLQKSYLSLLLGLARLYEERGDHESAAEAFRRSLVEEPTSEEAHASLMRLYALLGSNGEALAQYGRLENVLLRELGTKPAASSRALKEEIVAGRFPPKDTPSLNRLPKDELGGGKHNLPAARTSFVGRVQKLVEVKRTLAMTCLLTLTGAGGSGKTRLALEVARDLVESYTDGVWLVELAPLSEPGLVAQEVANVLGVQERPSEPLADTLVEAVAGKEMLLVLDNCEHLVEGAARLVDTLLASCPHLRVLSTSREPLAVPGEVNLAIPPLSLPGGTTNAGANAEALMRYEAVRLYVDRARLRLPDFEVTGENARAVARVCRKLDGIPLAIELATARMGVLAVEQVAQRLEVSLDILKSGSRTAEARQQTLRSTLDWSYDLLSEIEQGFFAMLSIFAGGWALEAAEAVCSGGSIEEQDVLDLLGGLVDKSLVVTATSTSAVVRYRMLEPIRQYAGEKLEESGAAEEVKSLHAAYFLAFAEEAELELAGPQQGKWVERLDGEHDNMREALSWSLEQGEARVSLRFGASLGRFWHAGGYPSEGIWWIERVLAEGEPAASPARVKALEGMGWLAQALGDIERAIATYEGMLTLSRELDDKGNAATALNSLAVMAEARGDSERARALLQENLKVLRELEEEGNPATKLKWYHALWLMGYLASNEENYARAAAMWEESLTLAREIGDSYRVLHSLVGLGYVSVLRGNYEQARLRCEEALALASDLGSAGRGLLPECLSNLGLAARERGDYDSARISFEEALTVSWEAEKKTNVIDALSGMAGLAGALGEATRAARLWGAAEAAREVNDIALPPGEWALHEPHLVSARSQLGEAAWEAGFAEGRAMTFEEAIGYALSKGEPGPFRGSVSEQLPADVPVINLTRREQEVAALVARGLTNRQVAQALSISERTAGNHVAKILKKLGLRSRTQIGG
jgi:predicted ATPase/DNA-binding SARP family transcriptional activator/DNA-binding CsgD family transcriptional regulator